MLSIKSRFGQFYSLDSFMSFGPDRILVLLSELGWASQSSGDRNARLGMFFIVC